MTNIYQFKGHQHQKIIILKENVFRKKIKYVFLIFYIKQSN